MFTVYRLEKNCITPIDHFKGLKRAQKVCDFLNIAVNCDGVYDRKYIVKETKSYWEEVKCAAERAAQE